MQREIQVIQNLANVIQNLRSLKVIRRHSVTGEIGEWIVAQLYKAQRAPLSQKGYDLLNKNGEKYEVRTQTYYPKKAQYNYFKNTSIVFDYLIALILKQDYSICKIYKIPAGKCIPKGLGGILTEEKKSGKLRYYWKDLAPYLIDPRILPGYSSISVLIPR